MSIGVVIVTLPIGCRCGVCSISLRVAAEYQSEWLAAVEKDGTSANYRQAQVQ